MKINSDDRLSYVELVLHRTSSEDILRISGRQDLNLSVEISCDGFRGRNNGVWFGQDEIQEFLKEMRVLEKERWGVAQLMSLGYPSEHVEFNLQIYSIDNAGHLALKLDLLKIRYSSRHELSPLKLSAGFELDSGDFRNIITEFESLFDFKRHYMLTEQVEEQFREYMAALRRSDRSVRKGGSLRDDFQRIWLTVIDDDSVRQVLRRMLFIPNDIPDFLQGNHLIRILDYLHGHESQLQFFDDIVVTTAEIIAVHTKRESGGPIFFVTYEFKDSSNKAWQFERDYGYDEMHAGFNGWGVKELSEYWKTGNKIPCHYRASQPGSHYLCQP